MPQIVHDVLQSPGQPLNSLTRDFVESRFGRDFSDVRVHTDAKAAESAKSVNAHAYTAGREVVFGSGQYQPQTEHGKRLIAHELTHVIQQQGRTYDQRMLSLEPSDSQEERVAEATANVAGSPTVGRLHSGGAAARIQRQSVKPAPVPGPNDAQGAAAARISRAEAAVKLLRRLYDRYQSNPADKENQHKQVATILRFLEDTVTDDQMRKAFSSFDVGEQRTARKECEDALYYVKRLEVAFRDGQPRLDDRRTWHSPIGSLDMAQRYLDQILNYREPIPLLPGWHKVIDQNGVILGYLHLYVGVTSIFDAQGKYVGGHELGLERPLIDPIDIVAGGISGIVRGPLRGALSSLARSATPRLRVAAFLASQGFRRAVPIIAGEAAPNAFVVADALASESVPAVLRGAAGSTVRSAVSQGASAEAASVLESSTTRAAAAQASTSAPAQGAAASVSPGVAPAAGPAAQSVAGGTGATVASNVAAPQADPRHNRGYGGEQAAGFVHYSQKDGWAFIQGPSGSQGHSVTGSGFDGMAYNQRLDLLDLVDNKSLSRTGNVSSATAIDPAKNLGQNLDDAIVQVTGMSDVHNRIRILELLRAKRAALAAGTPGPANVRLVVTHQGGRTTGVSGPLAGRGVISR